jgi:hypothetical protein
MKFSEPKKVRVKFKVWMSIGYVPYKYVTKTIQIPVPLDENGFWLFKTFSDNIKDHIKSNVIPKLEGVKGWELLSHEVLS